MAMLERVIPDSTSVKARFLVSLFTNFFRSFVGFLGGLLVARGLDPAGYGDLSFLLGSFAALRSLLDLGSSTAFYTFISQRSRPLPFYVVYYLWIAVQFGISVLLVSILMPDALIQKIWLGHSRHVLLLALLATFLQQQVWQTINQVGEAARKTIRVQALNLAVGVFHVGCILLLVLAKRVAVDTVLWLYVLEYVLVTAVSLPLLKECLAPSGGTAGESAGAAAQAPSIAGSLLIDKQFLSETFSEYRIYCTPLIFLSLMNFLHDFLDKWLLQFYGGAQQQGLFQIAFQFSAVSLLVTSSILRIFWKEVSAANEAKDAIRVAQIYRQVSRALVLFSAIISAAMIPWAQQIVGIILGEKYMMGWPVLAVMLLFPIHQSMGQIGSTMLLATNRTRTYMWLSSIVMVMGLCLSYLAQAPRTGVLIPGLALGAMGMGLKLLIVNVFSVNIQGYVISRHFDWDFDWLYQVVGIPLVVMMGYLSRFIVSAIWEISGTVNVTQLLLPVGSYALIYGAGVSGLVLAMPWLAGVTRGELMVLFRGLRSK